MPATADLHDIVLAVSQCDAIESLLSADVKPRLVDLCWPHDVQKANDVFELVWCSQAVAPGINGAIRRRSVASALATLDESDAFLLEPHVIAALEGLGTDIQEAFRLTVRELIRLSDAIMVHKHARSTLEEIFCGDVWALLVAAVRPDCTDPECLDSMSMAPESLFEMINESLQLSSSCQ